MPDYRPLTDDDRAAMIAWLRALCPRWDGDEYNATIRRLCDELEHYEAECRRMKETS
jgi:hypothetical protein